MTANVADFRLSVGDVDMRGDLFDLAAAFLDITDKVRPRLLSLRLTEKRGGEADQLDIELDDADGALALPVKGAPIRLSLGWARGADVPVGLIDKGRFVVDEVEWSGDPDRIRITARSADLTAGFRVRRETSHTGTTLGAIARKVAAANKLTPRIAPELDAVPIAAIAQHQVSDMALLRRLGREHDAVATVKDGRLILSPVGRGAAPGGAPLPPLVLRRSDGFGPRYRELDRTADAGVEARWHDQDGAQRRSVVIGGEGDGKPHRLRKVYHDQADATAAAKAEARRQARAEAEFEFTLALGRPDLYPERPTTLQGFKPPADAKPWILAELTHSLDGRGGLTTSLKLETHR